MAGDKAMTPERIAELRAIAERYAHDRKLADECGTVDGDYAAFRAATREFVFNGGALELAAEIERLQSQMAEMAKDLQQAVRLIGDVNDKYVAAENKVKRLRQAVADVEHESTCTNWQNGGPCNCWKAAFAQAGKPDFSDKLLPSNGGNFDK